MIRQLTRRSPQLAPLTVLFVLTAVGFVWFWQRTGTRALALLAIGIVLAIVIDGIWGFGALRRPDLSVHCPTDARVGDPMPVAVRLQSVGRPALLTMLSVPGSPSVRVHPPEAGVLDAIPLVSGRFPWAIFELTVRGPLGLVAWTRRAVVQLPQPILVAPKFVPHEVTFPKTAGQRPGETRGTTAQVDLVRSVRDYVPGDGSRLIHWAATARTGQLMVKELDPAGAGRLTIVLDLHQEHPGAEAASGRAGHLAERALAEGWSVQLLHRESLDAPEQVMPRLTGNRLPIRIVKRAAGTSQTTTVDVASATDAGRRLAAADYGPPELPRHPTGVVRLVCSSGDDRWLSS